MTVNGLGLADRIQDHTGKVETLDKSLALATLADAFRAIRANMCSTAVVLASVG